MKENNQDFTVRGRKKKLNSKTKHLFSSKKQLYSDQSVLRLPECIVLKVCFHVNLFYLKQINRKSKQNISAHSGKLRKINESVRSFKLKYDFF